MHLDAGIFDYPGYDFGQCALEPLQEEGRGHLVGGYNLAGEGI